MTRSRLCPHNALMAVAGLLLATFGALSCGQLIGIADVSDDGSGVGAEAGLDAQSGTDSALLADGAKVSDGAADGGAADATIGDGAAAFDGPTTFCTTHTGHTRCIDFEVPTVRDAVTATNFDGGSVTLDFLDFHSDATSLRASIPKSNVGPQGGGSVIVQVASMRKVTVDFWAKHDDASSTFSLGEISLFGFRVNGVVGDGVSLFQPTGYPYLSARADGNSVQFTGISPQFGIWNHYVFAIGFGSPGSLALTINGMSAVDTTSVATTTVSDPKTIEIAFIAASPRPEHPVNLRVDDVLIDVE